jgi:hypothetical protein
LRFFLGDDQPKPALQFRVADQCPGG